LLQRFIATRDESAFALLVRRHSVMVWGVCKRVLGHDQDAEDAFQATFTVLVRKAASIRPQSLLGNWLYGVAHQVAVKARAMNAKRMSREKQFPVPLANAAEKPDAWQELQPILDQELSLLPEKYRAVLVLCDLEGKTRKGVAVQLGIPEGTVAGRQARAQTMLAKRLARHGFTASGGTLAALLAQSAAAAAAPPSVIASAIMLGSILATGGVISARVAMLAEGVVKAMFLTNLQSTLAVVRVIFGVVAGVASLGGVFAQGNGQKPGALPEKENPPVQVKGKAGSKPQPVEAGRERLVGTWRVINDAGLPQDETWTIRTDRILIGAVAASAREAPKSGVGGRLNGAGTGGPQGSPATDRPI
jgi:RNA polymerase sigma factor (sigma-70 family)